MSMPLDPGLHAPRGRAVDSSAYERYLGRWSRLFVSTVVAAAEVAPGYRVLDVSTGTGEAARAIIPIVGASGFVVGADISPAMLASAREQLPFASFRPVAADGQELPFATRSFDAVVCQLGLQFFPNPGFGLIEFRRVLRKNARVAICVISTPERAPMWGILADVLSRRLPEQREMLQLSFALADAMHLERLLVNAGFADVRVDLETREDVVDGFDDYWEPIEAGTGSIPQLYLALSETDRRAVREEVNAGLAKYEVRGRLSMSVEMLIGSGRA
jgi:ubiquinone/menaquinone biosynthesis C-methylase UbiE